jgi:hypothetical protein
MQVVLLQGLYRGVSTTARCMPKRLPTGCQLCTRRVDMAACAHTPRRESLGSGALWNYCAATGDPNTLDTGKLPCCTHPCAYKPQAQCAGLPPGASLLWQAHWRALPPSALRCVPSSA